MGKRLFVFLIFLVTIGIILNKTDISSASRFATISDFSNDITIITNYVP